MIRQELQEFHEFMENPPQIFRSLHCPRLGEHRQNNLLAEVQARIASLARGKKRKADEPAA